jgi:hypothetical protein
VGYGSDGWPRFHFTSIRLSLLIHVHSYTHNPQSPTVPAGVYQLRNHYDMLSRENVNDVRLITKPYPNIDGAVQLEMTPDLKALLMTCVAAVCGMDKWTMPLLRLYHIVTLFPPSQTQAQSFEGRTKEADAQMMASNPNPTTLPLLRSTPIPANLSHRGIAPQHIYFTVY